MKKGLLYLFLLTSLVFTNNSCQKEYSLENGNSVSEGTLQDDGVGDCLPKNVVGAYVAGTPLVSSSNYVEVQVDVTTPGTYSITTDAVNGFSFRASGVFTATGLVTIQLRGTGTPTAVGIHNFTVTYGTSSCTFSVTTVGTLATFTLDGAPGGCTGATPAGNYTTGVLLNASNTVTINVNVTAIGAYSISTPVSNGMSFTGSGAFTITGPQPVVLVGSGTPNTSGPANFPITAGTSTCNFTVNVQQAAGAATFTVDCASAVVNGTYTVLTALVPATNTISLPVNVTAVGTYTITATLNGMTFTASGTFATATPQTVTLNGSGTPTTQGANAVPVTGGTGTCNVTVTVNPAAGGPATFTVNCAGAVVNGTYTVLTALVPATNTISLPVNVTAVGTYNITATLNGMTFTASGTFATATPQTVTLNGSGTPTTQGANSVPVTGGTGTCNVTVTVNPAAGGPATFAVDCSSANPNGTYTEGVALTAANTITITVNASVAGTYSITTTTINGMTFTASGTLVLGANTVTLTPTAGSTPTADGTFNIPVPSGTTPCTFPLDVDPAVVSLGTWSFTEGANNFSGIFVDAGIDVTTLPPFGVLFMIGETAAGHYFELDLVDVTAVIANGESYNCATFDGSANTGIFYLEGPAPASPVLYEADPSIVPNSMVVIVTSHNVATKTVTGTFSGNVKDGAGVTRNVTAGVFTVTYP